jgi:hypothetical protein
MGAIQMMNPEVASHLWQYEEVALPESTSSLVPHMNELLPNVAMFRVLVQSGMQAFRTDSDGKDMTEEIVEDPFTCSTDFIYVSTHLGLGVSRTWSDYLRSDLESIAIGGRSDASSVSLRVMFQVINETAVLLPQNMPRAAVVPTDGEGVELEWRKSKIHLRLVFNGATTYVWMDDLATGVFHHGYLEEVRAELSEALERMSRA